MREPVAETPRDITDKLGAIDDYTLVPVKALGAVAVYLAPEVCDILATVTFGQAFQCHGRIEMAAKLV